MIDHDREFIFVHLRRTAGNSIETALGGITLLDRNGNRTTNWDNSIHRGKTPYKIDNRGHYIHDTAQAICRQFPEQFQAYRKFTIIRNPWDQLASLYCRLFPEDHEAAHFKRWIMARARPDTGTLPFCSLFDTQGKLLVDVIGRYENLQSDFPAICKQCNIEQVALPVANTSSRPHYSEYYDRESREFVRRLCDPEIVEFGYQY